MVSRVFLVRPKRHPARGRAVHPGLCGGSAAEESGPEVHLRGVGVLLPLVEAAELRHAADRQAARERRHAGTQAEVCFDSEILRGDLLSCPFRPPGVCERRLVHERRGHHPLQRRDRPDDDGPEVPQRDVWSVRTPSCRLAHRPVWTRSRTRLHVCSGKSVMVFVDWWNVENDGRSRRSTRTCWWFGSSSSHLQMLAVNLFLIVCFLYSRWALTASSLVAWTTRTAPTGGRRRSRSSCGGLQTASSPPQLTCSLVSEYCRIQTFHSNMLYLLLPVDPRPPNRDPS